MVVCTYIQRMPCLEWVVSDGYLKDSTFGLVQFNEVFTGTFPKSMGWVASDNLVVTWKVKPRHYFLRSLWHVLVSRGSCTLSYTIGKSTNLSQ